MSESSNIHYQFNSRGSSGDPRKEVLQLLPLGFLIYFLPSALIFPWVLVEKEKVLGIPSKGKERTVHAPARSVNL